MAKKKDTIKLCVKGTNITQNFSFSHAERLLRLGQPLNGGWEIPEDSEYIFDKENGIRVKSN